MPVVIVEMWAGRTVEQKKQIAGNITEAFTRIGTPADQVQIIFKDNDKNNWSIGSKMASE